MYTRKITAPNHTFFLFGPRATGKTTWLRERFPEALWKNLLLDEDYLPLLGDTSLFRKEVEALAPNSWVVIDEVQKIPALLNQVHDLITVYGDKYKFAMSGSSARKLRRQDVNLLAGRAIERYMFPLIADELKADFELEKILAYGALPSVTQKLDYSVDILTSYIGTYLKQEIQQEALVDDVGSFHRFLSIAGLMNGEIINVSAIARDAAIARSTAERYFDILVDTLIGFRLPAWQPKLRVRERNAPKFYLFDPGIARTLAERVRDPLSDLELGKLLETFLLHELRASIVYQNCGGKLSYWRSSSGLEIDFIWSRGEKIVAIELKASNKWRKEDGRALKELAFSKPEATCYGVYRGKNALKDDNIQVLPLYKFLEALAKGEILS